MIYEEKSFGHPRDSEKLAPVARQRRTGFCLLKPEADVEVESVRRRFSFAVAEIQWPEWSIQRDGRAVTAAEIFDADVFIIIEDISPVEITQQVKPPGEFETQLKIGHEIFVAR